MRIIRIPSPQVHELTQETETQRVFRVYFYLDKDLSEITNNRPK